jgi:hypothetical protein
MEAVCDLDGDNCAELVFRHSSGALAEWCMDGTNCTHKAYLNPMYVSNDWQLVASADFDHDGKQDLVWQQKQGALGIWFMDDTNCVSTAPLDPAQAEPKWTIVGAGDFSGDGSPDLLWRNSTNGVLRVWVMNGISCAEVQELPYKSKANVGWKVVGTSDYNHDGHTDILWRHDKGALAYWLMNGTNCIVSTPLNPPTASTAWKLIGP